MLAEAEFYNAKVAVDTVNIDVNIYTNENSRLATQFFDLNPLDYKTKHDNFVAIVMVIAYVIMAIAAIVYMCTPAGWATAAAASIAYGVTMAAAAVTIIAAVELASSEVTKQLNPDAVQELLIQTRAELYAQTYILDEDDGRITVNRISDADVKGHVIKMYKRLQNEQ